MEEEESQWSEELINAKDIKPVPFFKLFAFADSVDVLLMILGSVGAIANGIALPLYFRILISFIDMFGSPTTISKHKIAQDCLNLVYLGLICWVASWIEVLFWTLTGSRQTLMIRTKYIQAILQQDIEKFDTSLNTGEIIENISSEMMLIQDALGEKMASCIHFLSSFIIGVILGFTLIWQLALVTVGLAPVIAVTAAFQVYMITTLSSRCQEAYGESNLIAEQVITQIRTVYSFVGEAKALQCYSNAIDNAMKMSSKIGLFNGLGTGTSFLSFYGAFALLVWFGSILYFHGLAKGGKILITMNLVTIGARALGQASLSFSTFGQARAAAGNIFPLIESFSKLDNQDQDGMQLENVEGEIIFDQLDFAYPTRPSMPVLQKFSFAVPSRKSVAIVGASGSGKSTLIALLERFYEPLSGLILLDGHDIRSLELKWLRMQLGLVSQEPTLFAMSIKDNIFLGKKDATLHEVEVAAKFATVDTFVQNLPGGYDAQVGEKGSQLSGGQRQRIALARAVLKNPPVLLLDEATSALDSSTELLIQAALDEFMISRTSIVIAHRLSTIQNVDIVVVLEKGKIIETGTHSDLMSKGESGAYYKLVKLQEMKGFEKLSSLKSCAWTPGPRTTRVSSMLTPKSSMRLFSLSHGSASFGGSMGSRFLSHPSPSFKRSMGSPSLSHRWASFGLDHSLSMDYSRYTVTDIDKIVLIKKAEEAPLKNGNFWRLVKLSAPEWPLALLGIFGSALTGAAAPIFGLLVGSVSTLFYSPSFHYVRREVHLYAVYFSLIAACSLVGCVIQEYFWCLVNGRLTKRIRERLLSAILKNEIAWFDRDENNGSNLSTRLSSDAAMVNSMLSGRVSLFVNNLMVLTTGFIISLFLSWKMALVTFVVCPTSILSVVIESAFVKGFSGNTEAGYQMANTIATEAVVSIRTVAAFCAEEKINFLFTEHLNKTKKQSLLLASLAGLVFGISRFLQFSSLGLSLWYGLVLVRHEKANPRHVMDVFFICVICNLSLGRAFSRFPDLMKGGAALQSVFAILERSAEIDPDDKKASVLDKVIGRIELREVCFSYPTRTEVPILKNFSLKVPAGKSMALVGPSGCGKSTVMALIERFYDPQSGNVMVDGMDIKSYNLRSLRRHIGLVQQEPALFATTIYDNILYGNADATEAEVEAAARAANAHDFISALPKGYQTPVGEHGIGLSGGQKQRVAIARAVLKNPAILLLDEATSALDSETEKAVQEALDRLMKGRTIVAIAHRLSSICNMDAISVVQDGAVVEQGTHSELLALKPGVYARLVAVQKEHQSS